MRFPRFTLRALAAAAGLALIASQALSQAPPTPRRISPGQAATDLNAIINDVSQARLLAVRISDASLRGQVDLLLSRAELNARVLRDKLSSATATSTPAAPAAPAAVADAPITPQKFEEFRAALKKNAFDNGKLQFIQDFGTSHRFTCDQAAVLLKEFSFDTDRVKAAVALHPRLVDPGDFYKVLDVFAFDSGKQAVRKAVGLR